MVSPSNEGRRVLITGIRGFTGRYLAARLAAAGHEVVGLAQEGAGAPLPGVARILAADLCDARSVRAVVDDVQPELVAHLAAIANVAHGSVEQMYRVNVLGSRALLEALAALAVPPRCVLMASSGNVYGNATVEIIDETTPVAPANDYGVSKLAMEQLARIWSSRLPVVIARPFNYTGVGQSEDFLLPKIVEHFRRRAPRIELGNLDVARDFNDVRVVVEAYARLLDAAPAGETFNVCSGRAVTLMEALDLMADLAGYRIDVSVNPAFVRPNELKRLQGDGRKLASCIGHLPDILLADTLRWMYEATAV